MKSNTMRPNRQTIDNNFRQTQKLIEEIVKEVQRSLDKESKMSHPKVTEPMKMYKDKEDEDEGSENETSKFNDEEDWLSKIDLDLMDDIYPSVTKLPQQLPLIKDGIQTNANLAFESNIFIFPSVRVSDKRSYS